MLLFLPTIKNDILTMNEKPKNDTISLKETSQEMNSGASSSFTESTWFSLVPMILIFVVMYFLVLRPQEKKQKEHASMVKSVKKGEKVLLSSGIFGTIVKASDESEYVNVQISENSIVTVLKSYISDILSRKENVKMPEFFGVLESDKKKTKPKKSKDE